MKEFLKRLFKSNKYHLPRNWSEITLGQMVAFQDETQLNLYFPDADEHERSVYEVACLTGLPLVIVMAMKNSDFQALKASFAWTNELPKDIPRISSVRLNGTKYGMKQEFTDEQIGKYVSFHVRNELEDLSNRYMRNEFSAVLRILAIVCHEIGSPYVDTQSRLSEREDVLRKISVVQALGLLDFFLLHYTKSTKTSPLLSRQPA